MLNAECYCFQSSVLFKLLSLVKQRHCKPIEILADFILPFSTNHIRKFEANEV